MKNILKNNNCQKYHSEIMVKINENSFNYSLVTSVQLPMIFDWLAAPHVREWFHGEGLENTLQGLDDFVQNKNKADGFTYWVGSWGDEPFSLLITSLVDPTDQSFKLVPLQGTTVVTLDMLIGPTDYLDKGYGTRLIVDFLQNNFPQASDFIIDPEVANTRAIHVYQKVGFKIINTFIASWHPVPHFLMHMQNTLSIKE